jgi:glycerophosphoryl diester phosphodiesterase
VSAPLLIAHRTCPQEAPENSLSGLSVAAALGADGVEIDLRMSLDQRPFLMHDNSLRRTTGFLLPLELTPAFLVRRLRLRNSSEGVPSLGEAIEALPTGLFLAVDVKTPWAVLSLMRQIKRHGLESRVLVWCTSALAARYAARAAVGVEVAYLKDVTEPAGKRRFIAKAVHMGVGAISAHWRAIDRDFVAAAHAKGLRVYAYHGGYELVADKLASGLDGLITDFPVSARVLLSELPKNESLAR